MNNIIYKNYLILKAENNKYIFNSEIFNDREKYLDYHLQSEFGFFKYFRYGVLWEGLLSQSEDVNQLESFINKSYLNCNKSDVYDYCIYENKKGNIIIEKNTLVPYWKDSSFKCKKDERSCKVF